MQIQADGKILIAGHARVGGQWEWRVQRLLTTGLIDTSFGTDGTYVPTTSLGTSDNILAMQIQVDSKILIAGYATVGGQKEWRVQRLLTTGLIDTSFGNEGTYVPTTSLGTSDNILAMQIQVDSKILIAGYATVGGQKEWRVQRLLTTGLIDTSFGTNGTYVPTTSLGTSDKIEAMQIQADGKILIAGYATVEGEEEWRVQRLLTTGLIDTSFGNEGTYVPDPSLGTEDMILAMQIQVDNKILIAGYATVEGEEEWRVQRLLTTGLIDTSFGTNGTYVPTTSLGAADYINRMQIQADGAILLGGNADDQWRVQRLLNDIPPLTQIAANGNGGIAG
ncbi:MAG: putative delta-60 repeat protein [Alteromonas naphthalenivorans]